MTNWMPQSILVLGCGLMGTSFAKAVAAKHPGALIVGVEVTPEYRALAAATEAFQSVASSLPAGQHFDLTVLATPADIAALQLPEAARISDLVMDVCSAKRDICAAADTYGLREVFAPTHPMAGAATPGPSDADAALFVGRTWITIAGWPSAKVITPFLETLGANVVEVKSPEEHDLAMAAVSHGIHVTSLAAMLSYDSLQAIHGGQWSKLSGPAFRDITRLASSPVEFWASTLLANREHVLGYLETLQAQLDAVRVALQTNDKEPIAQWLSSAQSAHRRWREEHL